MECVLYSEQNRSPCFPAKMAVFIAAEDDQGYYCFACYSFCWEGSATTQFVPKDQRIGSRCNASNNRYLLLRVTTAVRVALILTGVTDVYVCKSCKTSRFSKEGTSNTRLVGAASWTNPVWSADAEGRTAELAAQAGSNCSCGDSRMARWWLTWWIARQTDVPV